MDIKNKDTLFIHFGAKAILDIAYGPRNVVRSKPNGLWASRLYTEEDDIDYFPWIDWCIGEDFNINRLFNFSIFQLVGNPKILDITDLSNVNELYYVDEGAIARIRKDIYDRYDGVELYHGENYSLLHLGIDLRIDPYSSGRYQISPYYLWDVDSICLFDNSFIKQLSNDELVEIVRDTAHPRYIQLTSFLNKYFHQMQRIIKHDEEISTENTSYEKLKNSLEGIL